MSYTVNAATLAPVSASISTPVRPPASVAVHSITADELPSIRTSTSTHDSDRGWHSGISSDVRLAAMMPARRAVAKIGPLGPWASPPSDGRPSSVTISGGKRTVARAVADRLAPGLFDETSTMRATGAPRSSARWVKADGAGGSAGRAVGVSAFLGMFRPLQASMSSDVNSKRCWRSFPRRSISETSPSPPPSTSPVPNSLVCSSLTSDTCS
mmetsp:Transcript_27282/g.54567  ORF Transcript_27282/g.54567 Transcript_27282/m.54567 type:complete len:212 (-) Transcript_27282:363-998(-)